MKEPFGFPKIPFEKDVCFQHVAVYFRLAKAGCGMSAFKVLPRQFQKHYVIVLILICILRVCAEIQTQKITHNLFSIPSSCCAEKLPGNTAPGGSCD